MILSPGVCRSNLVNHVDQEFADAFVQNEKIGLLQQGDNRYTKNLDIYDRMQQSIEAG